MLEDQLLQGNPAFLDAVDALTDPGRLRALARCWATASGDGPRRLLLGYLDRSLNPFHEPLVICLFRRACATGDDEVMGRFLLLFDRSLRLQQRPGGCWRRRPTGMQRGQAIGGAYIVRLSHRTRVLQLSDRERRDYEAYRLFAVPTRLLLRRRAWRYFDRLACEHPRRYVPALAAVLSRYTDDDVKDEATFLSRSGLLRVLFGRRKNLRPFGCGSWLQIPAAPAHESLWLQHPALLLELAMSAPCRLVSQWAGELLQRLPPQTLSWYSSVALFDQLPLLSREAGRAAVAVLLSGNDCSRIPVETWLALLSARGEWVREPVLKLSRTFLPPERLTVTQAVQLACSPFPDVAWWGWHTYVAHHLKHGTAEPELLLPLLDAPIESLRMVMAAGLRTWLSEVDDPLDWFRAFVDSAHANVRDTGRLWLMLDHRLQKPQVWRYLTASPHPDVRDWMRAILDHYQRGQPRTLRDALPLTQVALSTLWARVLLTPGGNGKQELLVRQLVQRAQWQPEDGVHLLPMLALVLQHSKGPVRRTALTGLVQLVERHPQWEEIVTREMPGLVLRPRETVS